MPSALFNALSQKYGASMGGGGGSPLLRSLQKKYGAAPSAFSPVGGVGADDSADNAIFSGNAFEDVIDTLSTPAYAIAGFAHTAQHQEEEGQGYSLGGMFKGAAEGVKNRASWRDFLQDHELFGVKMDKAPKWVPAAVGTVLDMFVDPADLLVGPAIGLAGKGIAKGSKAVGLTDAVRAMPAPQALLSAIDKVSDYPLRGRTIGDVVERLADDRPLLQKFMKLTDAREMEKDTLLEPSKEVVQVLGGYNKKLRSLMYDFITEPDMAKKSRILVDVETAMKADGVKNLAAAGNKFVQDADAVRALQISYLDKLHTAGLVPSVKADANYLRRSYAMYDDPKTWQKALTEMPTMQASLVEMRLKQAGIDPLVSPSGVKGTVGKAVEKVSGDELGLISHRENISPFIREALGEVKDVRYSVAKGAVNTSNLISKRNFLENVAKEFARDFPNETLGTRAGYVLMPADQLGWGAVAGKWVPEVVARQLQDAAAKPTEMARLMKKGVGWWKFGKVVTNPATHARNTLTNFALIDWGTGLTPLTPRWFKYVGKAAKELATKGPGYKEAKTAGTFLVDTFAGRELPAVLREAAEDMNPNKLAGLFGWMKATGKKAGDLYEFEEQLGKMTMYLSERDRLIKGGMKAVDAATKAAETAEKWLFNYRKVPKWVDMMRSPSTVPGMLIASPFITFSYKAAPRITEAAINNPTRITKYFKLGRGVEAVSDAEETMSEKQVMADWMKKGLWLKLPWKDNYNRSLYLDATYLVPLADWAGSNVTGPGQKPVLMAAPLGTLLTDLVRNQSQFTGKAIYTPGTSKHEVAKRIGDYVAYAWQNLAPPLAPGGYGFKNITDAMAKRPDWLGRTRSLGYVLAAQVAGMKTRPFDYSEEASTRAKEYESLINETEFALSKQLANPAIGESEKEQIWNNAMERINWILGKMDETFSSPDQQSVPVVTRSLP